MADKKPTCRVCGGQYTARGLTRHLQSCLGETDDTQRTGYHLKISSAWDDYSMLHVLVDRFATFAALDSFLRGIWLECCGHLSSFMVGDVRYEANAGGGDFGWGEPPRPMGTKVHKVLEHGLDFRYIYDWGSSTELEISCYGQRPWPATLEEESPESREQVLVLARNEPPEIECEFCDSDAEFLCTDCQYGGLPMCEEHADEHECGVFLLPVVNSPRMGVCGYTGTD
ncbi:MAG: hypothetical protein ACQEVA_12960 [Myxococcota bacterium]